MHLVQKADRFKLLGEVSQNKGDFLRAKVYFSRALHCHECLRDSLGIAQASIQLGDVSRQAEDFKDAARWYNNAQKFSKILFPSSYKKQTLFLDAEIGLALTARAKQKWAEALRRFRQLTVLYQQSNDRQGMAFALWSRGTTERFMACFGLAEKNLRKAISLSHGIKDSEGTAYAFCGLGGTLRMIGQPSASREAYKKAQHHFQQTKDQFGLAYSNCGIGNSYRMEENFKLGLSYSEKAAKLYKRIKQQGPLAFVLWSMAQGEIALSRYSQARNHLTQAERIFSKVQDRRGTVYSLLGWGEFYRARKESVCLSYYRKALGLARALKLPFEACHAQRGILIFKNNLKNSNEIKKLLKPIYRRYRLFGTTLAFESYLTIP